MASRKIVIFGATGTTGLCALKHAVSKGYNVCAFVRNASLVPEEYVNKIDIIVGNVTSYESVLKAVTGRDEVVVVLGTRDSLEPTTELSDGMQNIVKAMKETGAKLISLCLSTFLFYDDVPKVFLNINEEHKRMLSVAENSQLNWVAVCPPRIEDMPKCKFVTSVDPPPIRRCTVSKFDLGEFMVECLQNPENFCKRICIFASPPESANNASTESR